MMRRYDRQLEGCIDMHVHSAPDPFRGRKCTAVEIARQSAEAGMRGVVLKCHHYLTTPLCVSLNELGLGVELLGSLALNRAVGGLNPQAVLVAGRLGTKVVWMPTFDSVVDAPKRGEAGIAICDQNGNLFPEVEEILEIIREYGMVLSTGHIAEAEVFALASRATKMGVKLVVTHPLTTVGGSPLSLEQQKRLVSLGAYIEHTYVACMPAVQGLDPMRLVEAIRAVGAEHCIVSSDFGQDYNPPPVEGMRMALTALKKCGLNDRELELTTKTNPARLLGIQ